MEELFIRIAGDNPIVQGFAAGVVIAFLNLVGALTIFVVRNPSKQLLTGALGFSAGVMLAASFTSLILPGIELGGLLPVVIGIALGALFLDRSDAWMPHAHILISGRFRRDQNPESTARAEGSVLSARFSALMLFIMAITIHNMPEGLAVGVGFGTGETATAISLMIAIGLQNIPEGLAVSIAARNAGMGGHFYAAFVGIRAGLVEIPLAVIGAAAVTIAEPLLPYAMGFAAGAMLYVVSDEIIPETHSSGFERVATFGTMIGLVVMLSLDVSLGWQPRTGAERTLPGAPRPTPSRWSPCALAKARLDPAVRPPGDDAATSQQVRSSVHGLIQSCDKLTPIEILRTYREQLVCSARC